MHQSLHHVVADAPWSDEAVLDRCLDFVIPAMLRRDPVVAWVVDDTGFPKKGRESVGVARQYCGQVGKQDNCRVAVSLSVITEKASMPVAYRLYLPQSWIEDRKRRKFPSPMFNFSANHLVLISRTEYPSYAVFLMQDRKYPAGLPAL
jgi:SRSO17 transposase